MDHVSIMFSHVQLSHNSLISIVDVILMTSNYGKKHAGKNEFMISRGTSYFVSSGKCR